MPHNAKGPGAEASDPSELAQLPGRSVDSIRLGLARVQDGEAIYAGQHLIGWLLVRRDGRYDAVAANGVHLGRFNERRPAALTLLEHARPGEVA